MVVFDNISDISFNMKLTGRKNMKIYIFKNSHYNQLLMHKDVFNIVELLKHPSNKLNIYSINIDLGITLNILMKN